MVQFQKNLTIRFLHLLSIPLRFFLFSQVYSLSVQSVAPRHLYIDLLPVRESILHRPDSSPSDTLQYGYKPDNLRNNLIFHVSDSPSVHQ